MSINNLRDQFPDYAKDIKLNLGNVLTVEGAPDLTLNQILGIALASAYATRSKPIIEAVLIEAATTLNESEIQAAKAAASVMAMNNIYYRFVHYASDKEFSKMPPKLRMNVIGASGIAKTDFELYALAVSAINGCGLCMDSHTKVVAHSGITALGIQSAIRIAATINAAAQVIDIENH